MQVRWETLKKKAIEAAYNSCGIYDWIRIEDSTLAIPVAAYAVLAAIDGKSKWRDNLVEMREMACTIVERWDIRCAMQLVNAFPSILPKKYHNKTPSYEIDDEGNWMIYFN